MTDKKAEALEAMRSATSELLGAVMDNDPLKNIHQHLWSMLSTMTGLMEELSKETKGKHERETSTDTPTQADPKKYPGGKHRASEDELIEKEIDNLLVEERSRLFGTPTPITEEALRLRAEKDFEEMVRNLVGDISYKGATVEERYKWKIEVDRDQTFGDRLYIQIQHWRPDVNTGTPNWGHGGKRYLSRHMTRSEVVRQIFAAFMAYEEHECREWFKYQARAVFGPHIDVDALHAVSTILDTRS